MNYLKRQTAINELIQFGLANQKRLEQHALRLQEAASLENGIAMDGTVASLTDDQAARLAQSRSKRAEAAQLLATAKSDLASKSDLAGQYRPVFDEIKRLADAGDALALQQRAVLQQVRADMLELIQTANGM